MPDDRIRDHAIRLYTFLKEFVELRTEAVRSLDAYDQVLWLSEVPRERECVSAIWHREDDGAHELWLEVHKPRVPSLPPLPPELQPWLREDELRDTKLDMPELRLEAALESVDAEGNATIEHHRLDEHPEIKPSWERYVETQWWPWRDERRRVDPIQAVYTALFTMYQKQQRLGEQYEIVLGLGLLNWRLPSGQTARRHLIVAHGQLSFDIQRGVIALSPAADGATPVLEQDMIDPQYRPAPEQLAALTAQVDEIADRIWDPVMIDAALQGWVNLASPRATYRPELSPDDTAREDPQVRLAPGLILRKRTDRSFLRAFDEIIGQLKAGAPVPEGVGEFVSIPAHASGADVGKSATTTTNDPEIYFPLEANDAQKRIVERLRTNPGVLVQGPPGTGKSHTIVNLICHLLASGQRVLVTSHTARALGVIQRYVRERVPEIAPLAVVLLGEGQEALQAMEESVQGITSRQHAWEPDAAERRVADLTKELHEAREHEAAALAQLRAIRERETYVHPIRPGGYAGTLGEIARRLRVEQGRYSWLQDRPAENTAAPLSAAEFRELVQLHRNGDVQAAEKIGSEPPHLSDAVAPAEFGELTAAEKRAIAEREGDARLHSHGAYRALAGSRAEQRNDLARKLGNLLAQIDRLDRSIHKWAPAATRQILGDQDRAWRELFERTKAHLKAVEDRARRTDELQVSGLGQRDHNTVRADAKALLAHLQAGGGWGLAGPLRPEAARRGLYLKQEVRLGGVPCDSTNALESLLSWLDVEDKLRQLRSLWKGHCAVPGTSFAALAAEFADLCEPLEAALALHPMVAELQDAFAKMPGLPEPTWHEPATVLQIFEVIQAADRADGLRALHQRLAAEADAVQRLPASPPYTEQLRTLAAAMRSRDTEGYRTAFEGLLRARETWSAVKRRKELTVRLAATAPRFSEDLLHSTDQDVWYRRADQLEGAWAWAQTLGWIDRLSDPAAEQQTKLRLDMARTRVRNRLGEIAALKAWGHCFRRMSEHERQHLVAWSKAVRGIGRGKGRYTPMHRRHARDHMNECRGAIPAWVMPLYRVAETVRVGRDLFDVAIIDEASQSGPEALLLAYMARQLVVVGDDKQISPSYVGIDREDVIHIRNRHIAGLPHADAYGVDQSFFDLAEIRYRGRIRLREHFRCMPEIIQFSNSLCYSGEPLIPLRQYGSDRLAPVVEARYVESAYQSGSGSRQVNLKEAEAVAGEVRRCLSDPHYKGKTFGVISLLGEHQAREIESRLIQTVGPEEMERRQLVCGDAYAFQGDERDVIFLSLVSAPTEGRRIATLAGEPDKRRFNVAASRARDQMVLYHSATVNDLGATCFRRAFLSYCLKPTVKAIEGSINVPAIRQLASDADRTAVDAPEPFESWFEVDVFLRIADRGYRVIPQHEVAGYRIDLVVEGMKNRLAVECDGDRWHGAEQYERDMGRQRDLERCGWTFWRLRSSTFELNPDGALDALWEALRRADVNPMGTATVEPETIDVGRSVLPPPALDPDFGGTESEAITGVAENDGAADSEDIAEEAPDLAPDGLDITEPEPPGSGGADPQLIDATYVEWKPTLLPEPKYVPVGQVIPGLLSIVRAEGPIAAHRACQIYVKGAGRQRVGKEFKRVLYSALRRAVSQGLLEARVEERDSGLAMQILRMKDSPVIRVRPRGPRSFHEIPPSEVAEVMNRLEAKGSDMPGADLHRAVLAFYDTRRMTTQIESRLRWIDEQRRRLRGPGIDSPSPTRLM